MPQHSPKRTLQRPGAPQNEVRKMKNALILPPHGPKSTPKRPRSTPNRPRQELAKQPQKRSKRVKKSTPNREMKKEPLQDDQGPKTLPHRCPARSFPPPPGVHLVIQNEAKTKPKTIQKRNENGRATTKRSRRCRIRLGAILGRLGAPCQAEKRQKPLENIQFRERSPF